MSLSDYVTTFGQHMQKQHGKRIHKIAINAGFTCPNRDGFKGIGGCTFCNNASFNPTEKSIPSISKQISAGQTVIRKRTGAKTYMAYFQAYTNTYAEVDELAKQYEQALSHDNICGLSIGTRPDCVPDEVLELLSHYKQQGHDVWLELGLQSSHEASLKAVNRGHGFSEYIDAIKAAHRFNLPVCTHLILGMPGENFMHMEETLRRIIELGVEGIKLHPMHIVKGTQLARQWKQGLYKPLSMQDYISIASTLIEQTPDDIIFHRVTGTAQDDLLLAPQWCSKKWVVINGIENELKRRHSYQGRFSLKNLSRLDFH